MNIAQRLVVVMGVGFLAACSGGDGGSPTAPGQVATNGQTGSSGLDCKADECQAQAERWLSWMNDTSAPTFVDSVCQEGSDVGSEQTLAVRSCKCVDDQGKPWLVDATGAGPECLAWGRGHMACVYPSSAGATCEVGDEHSCDAVCDRLEHGYAEDAAATHTAEVRTAQCGASRWSCDQVVRVDDACYASDSTGFFGPSSYDCSLSDAEILAARDGQ